MDAGRVLIAGAGPVGMTAAANLVRCGVPVTVLEAAKCLSEESRASTFHPPTLDMLQDLGVSGPLIAHGLVAPKFQYRARRSNAVAEFDFGEIADLTRHPYRVQNEQFKLTRLLWDNPRDQPHFELCFNSRVKGIYQSDTEIRVEVQRDGRTDVHSGAWLIGADGARSAVRRALVKPKGNHTGAIAPVWGLITVRTSVHGRTSRRRQAGE